MESKIELTDRLRREGRWSEASQFRHKIIKACRSRGLTKAAAREHAWKETAKAFPPATAEDPPDVLDDELSEWCSTCLDRVAEWRRVHGVALTDGALRDLVLAIASCATDWPKGDSDWGWGMVSDWAEQLIVADLEDSPPADPPHRGE